MNIKEIIDAERWGVEDEHGYYGCQVYKHNACLDRIEDAVTKHIAEFKSDNNYVFHRALAAMAKRITELEEQVEAAYKRGYDAGYTNGFQ